MAVETWQPGTLYLPGALVQPGTVSPPVESSPLPNASFESGDTAWTYTLGWAIVEDATKALTGSWVAKFTADAIYNFGSIQSGFGEVTASQAVEAKAFFSGPAGGQFSAKIQIGWYDSTQTFINYTDGERLYNNLGPGGYKQLTFNGNAPVNAAYARFNVVVYGDGSGGPGDIYVDDCSWSLTALAPGSDPVPTGLLFQAIQEEAGVSGETEPVWPTTAGLTVVDNEVTWQAVAGSTVTWEAHALLTSGDTEPVWPLQPGDIVLDGNMAWKAVRLNIEDPNCPNTREVAIASSKIFAGDDDITRFSATLNPRDWTTRLDAGFLPTGLQQKGQVGVTAIGVYRGNLVVWSQSNFQVWQVDPDPQAMSLLDSMEGIGSGYFKAVQPVSNDLFFLAALGVRTVGVAVGSTNLAAGDAGIPIDPLVQAEMVPGVDPIATYYPSMGQYWIAFPPATDSTPGNPVEPPVVPGSEPVTQLSSSLYPMYAFDEWDEALTLPFGQQLLAPQGHFDESLTLSYGLLDVVVTYGAFSAPPEEWDEALSLTYGLLDIVVTYGSFSAPPEEFDEALSLSGGLLEFVTNYLQLAAEPAEFDEALSLTSGSLAAP